MRREQAYGLGRHCRRSARQRRPDARPDVIQTLVPTYAREALEVLLDAGKQAFLVGGFVRDALRGVRPHDVDMTTDALWYQTRDIFIGRGYRVVETGARHGTVTVFVAGHPVEITTFRTDGFYSDHRRPDSVRYVRNVEEDLARRDFTVNAMAWSPDAGLVDPFGGRSDLAAGLVRAVGDPRRRFEEDALRVIRGVRFASKLDFAVEEATSDAIHACVPDLSLVTRERIGAEYDGIVRGPGAVAALRAYPDVAACAVPPIAAMVGFEQHSKWHCYDVWEHCLHALGSLPPDVDPLVRHTALLHDVGKPSSFTVDSDGHGHFYGHEEQGSRMLHRALENLRWRRADIDRICCLVRLHDHRIDPTPRGVRRMLACIASSFAGAEECAPQLFEQLLQVKRADAIAHDPSCAARRLREIERVEQTYRDVRASEGVFRLRDLAVGGTDVLDTGVPAGPAVGRILRRLLAQVVDGALPNDRDVLLAALRELTSGDGAPSAVESR